MGGTQIHRIIPTDEFLALLAANNPSAANPFATMADIAASAFSIPVYANRTAFPPAATMPNRYVQAGAAEGAKWRQTLYGGTYNPKGIWYSDGTVWDYMGDVPYQADQFTADAGLNNDQFMTSLTTNNLAKWGTKVDNRTTTLQTSAYLVTNSTRNVECSGTFVVTLPLLASITHYEDIDISNNGVGVVTVNTSGGEFLGNSAFNETTIDLYSGESLTVAKGDTTYIVK